MPEIENLVEHRQALKKWIIGRLGGQWSDLPDAVLFVLVDRPELAIQLMLVEAVQDLVAAIQLLPLKIEVEEKGKTTT